MLSDKVRVATEVVSDVVCGSLERSGRLDDLRDERRGILGVR